MLMDPDPSQQHAGPQHEVLQQQQKVTRPKATFERLKICFYFKAVLIWASSCHGYIDVFQVAVVNAARLNTHQRALETLIKMLIT